MDLYVGQYISKNSIKAQIFIYNNHLIIQITTFSVYLNYIGNNTFTLYIPPGTMTCMMDDLLAFSGEYVLFSKDNKSFEIPGIIYGETFMKG